MTHPAFLDEGPHGELPELPDSVALTCPAKLDDDTVCGAPMAFAHNVREFYPVHSWSGDRLVLGSCADVDEIEGDSDPHLWCTAGHDWAVPTTVEFE